MAQNFFLRRLRSQFKTSFQSIKCNRSCQEIAEQNQTNANTMQPTGGGWGGESSFSKSAKTKCKHPAKMKNYQNAKTIEKNAFANLPHHHHHHHLHGVWHGLTFFLWSFSCIAFIFLRKKCNTPESFALTALALANVSGKLNVFFNTNVAHV